MSYLAESPRGLVPLDGGVAARGLVCNSWISVPQLQYQKATDFVAQMESITMVGAFI